MKELSIIFMGTPPFAVHCLRRILEAGFNIVGVVTAPDRPAGRGRKLQESAVKQFAERNNLKVMQPQNLKSLAFQEELQELQPDIQVVVAFRMLPKMVWALPPKGTFNLHASLLPQYRGAAPINWAIINGEKTTGVTTFFLDEKIDTGEVILQETINIPPDETAGSLHDRLMETGAELIISTLELLEQDKVKPIPQHGDRPLKDAPKLTRENTRIPWDRPLEEIFDHIRGLDPFPAAWTFLKNASEEVTVKLFRCHMKKGLHELEPGTIRIWEKRLQVAVKGGFLVVEELQLPGKKKMKVQDLLNGYHFSEGAKFR